MLMRGEGHGVTHAAEITVCECFMNPTQTFLRNSLKKLLMKTFMDETHCPLWTVEGTRRNVNNGALHSNIFHNR